MLAPGTCATRRWRVLGPRRLLCARDEEWRALLATLAERTGGSPRLILAYRGFTRQANVNHEQGVEEVGGDSGASSRAGV